ncbi:MAG: hypothetical protein Q7S01_00545 [bacterium]|nr:hypothetical protein [bacterium]
METTKIHPLNALAKYKAMLKPKWRSASLMRLAGLISKKEAKEMLKTAKKARAEWR